MYRINRWLILVAAGLLAALMIGCSAPRGTTPPETPATEPATAVPVTPTEAPTKYSTGTALVDAVHVSTNPEQSSLVVTVTGNLQDGCTELADQEIDRSGQTFRITLNTRRPVEMMCTEALVPFEITINLPVEDVTSGAYTVVVNGVRGGIDLASDAAGAQALPESCRPESGGQVPYVNLSDGYCLLFPSRFRVGDIFPRPQPGIDLAGIAALYGPPQDMSLEPLRPGLSIVRIGPANGRSLSDVVDDQIAATLGVEAGASPAGIELARSETVLGGETAVVVDGLPGRTENRQLWTIHDDMIYHLTLYLTGADFPAVQEDVAEVWQLALASFAFLSTEFVAAYERCPKGDVELSPFLNVADGYCLHYPNHFALTRQPEMAIAQLVGPALDQSPEPVRAMLTIERRGADGRSLSAIVDQIVADAGLPEIRRTPLSLGGVPAELVEGLPGRMEARSVFVVHDDRLYQLRFEPYGLAQAEPDLIALWERVTGSFTFTR